MGGVAMRMMRRQRGFTLTGLILVSGLVFAIILVVLKLFPFVKESFSVKRAMQSVVNQPASSRNTPKAVLKLFQRSLDINTDDTFTDEDLPKYAKVKKIKGSRDKMLVMVYEKRGTFFWNFDIVMKFNHSVVLPSGASPGS